MRDILTELVEAWRGGGTIGLATVVDTFKSAPRLPGASMLVAPDGSAAGSVSGGCVEGAVYELATDVVADGVPVLQRYGVSDDDAFSVGLTCGGIIDVFVEAVSQETFSELGDVAADIEAGNPVAVATVIEHPDAAWVGRRMVVWPDRTSGAMGSERADQAVADDVRGLLASGRNGVLTYGPDGQRLGAGMRVFAASYAPSPRMLIFGAIDFASAMARQGHFLGYHVTVCDARPIFATRARFPDADEVVVQWPHDYLQAELDAGRIDGRTVIGVLTHDPKFDIPLLHLALTMPPVAFIGAMGSRKTHQDRLDQLQELGLTDEQLGRLSSPIGLDLGARTPEETAVSIAAEIISDQWGGGGDKLSELAGRIHHD